MLDRSFVVVIFTVLLGIGPFLPHVTEAKAQPWCRAKCIVLQQGEEARLEIESSPNDVNATDTLLLKDFGETTAQSFRDLKAKCRVLAKSFLKRSTAKSDSLDDISAALVDFVDVDKVGSTRAVVNMEKKTACK